jgi:isoleucyl-tRNA synthetase
MGDWENGYKTMDKDFETRQLNVFYEMMNKGLIYRANKPVYWSPSSKTALAESELEYKDDHKSRSAWVAFHVDQPCKLLTVIRTLENCGSSVRINSILCSTSIG